MAGQWLCQIAKSVNEAETDLWEDWCQTQHEHHMSLWEYENDRYGGTIWDHYDATYRFPKEDAPGGIAREKLRMSDSEDDSEEPAGNRPELTAEEEGTPQPRANATNNPWPSRISLNQLRAPLSPITPSSAEPQGEHRTMQTPIATTSPVSQLEPVPATANHTTDGGGTQPETGHGHIHLTGEPSTLEVDRMLQMEAEANTAPRTDSPRSSDTEDRYNRQLEDEEACHRYQYDTPPGASFPPEVEGQMFWDLMSEHPYNIEGYSP